jgi:hypothetical protein
MEAVTINRLIKGLGRTYEALLADGLVRGAPPVPLFTEGENEDLIQKPAPGIELWFWAETHRLERIVITLSALVDGDPVYTGELPNPFTHKMSQASVRTLLGSPISQRPREAAATDWRHWRLGCVPPWSHIPPKC